VRSGSEAVVFIEARVRPNEMRLSCAAVLWFSQTQFYYDGRRQLQPLVRPRGHDYLDVLSQKTLRSGTD